MHRGDWVAPKLRRMRFDEWADAFEDGLVRLAPTTARRYRQLLTLQIRPWFGGRPIAGIDYQDVESFIIDLYRRDYSAKTVRDCVSVLSLVMKAALRAKVIRENPAAGHHVKVARQRDQVLPLDQLHRLVEHTREDYRLAVTLLIYTGMRPSELCGLRVRHLDLLKGSVHVGAPDRSTRRGTPPCRRRCVARRGRRAPPGPAAHVAGGRVGPRGRVRVKSRALSETSSIGDRAGQGAASAGG
jgi:integrase